MAVQHTDVAHQDKTQSQLFRGELSDVLSLDKSQCACHREHVQDMAAAQDFL